MGHALRAFLQLVSLLTVACLPQVVSAAGVVTTNTESALVAAMAGGGTVTFAVNGIIYLTNTIVVSNNTTMDATGYNVGISGSNAVGIFVVNAGMTLILTNLTLRDGLAMQHGPPTYELDGFEGGAIYNSGTLQMTDCTFSNNIGGSSNVESDCVGAGGAIYNAGTVTGIGCNFTGNSAFGALGFMPSPPEWFPAYGGAIFNSNQATFVNCTFSNNIASGGPASPSEAEDNGSPGGDADGGALCNQSNLVVSNCTFALNMAVSGQGGVGGMGDPNNYGPGAPGAYGGGGGAAAGGAVCSLGGSCLLVNDTFWSNSAIAGQGGQGGSGGDSFYPYSGGDGGNGGGGGIGAGGSFCALAGSLIASNITAASNSAAGGLGGLGGIGGLNLYHTGNVASGTNGPAGSGEGDAVGNLGGTVTLKNSILCSNTPADTNIYGPVVDAGNNIDSDTNNTLTNSTSYNGINPLLAPLGNYGGLTATMALLPGSPAIDHADVHAFPPTDQRGHPRPYGPAPDIGAFEYAPANTLISGAYSSGQLHLAYQGTNGQTYCIQTSVNFSQWYPIATNTIGLSGYQDLAYAVTNFPHQYFRAVSP